MVQTRDRPVQGTEGQGVLRRQTIRLRIGDFGLVYELYGLMEAEVGILEGI